MLQLKFTIDFHEKYEDFTLQSRKKKQFYGAKQNVTLDTFSPLNTNSSKAERTLSPHDMNRQGPPLPSTPFNHRSVSRA